MEQELPRSAANNVETPLNLPSTSFYPTSSRQRGNRRVQNYSYWRRQDANYNGSDVNSNPYQTQRGRGSRSTSNRYQNGRKWTPKNQPKKEKTSEMSVTAKEFVPRGASSQPSNASAADELNFVDPFMTNRRTFESRNPFPFERKNTNRGSYSNGNWFNRKKQNSNNGARNSPSSDMKNTHEMFAKEDEASHRDRLIEQLSHNSCECSVCCDRVRPQDPVWNCRNCYNIFHLKCIRKWARSPAAVVESTGWRCPVCQHVSEVIPNQYYCFCGKMRDPPWNHYDTPHSCGDPCNKKKPHKHCIHKCHIPCHPGPCPTCQIQVERSCACGKTIKVVRCGKSVPVLCEQICSKTLNCGVHKCQKLCHLDTCGLCTEMIKQTCYCGKQSKEVLCTEDTVFSQFSCESACNRPLNCGLHTCDKICHIGPCEQCQLTPELITHCPCGKTLLSDLKVKPRDSCKDPIASCGQVCGKELPCGLEDKPHLCQSVCHMGACPNCPLKTLVKCRCGAQSKEVACTEKSAVENFSCAKQCKKKRQCGRHKCLQKCCIDEVHQCSQQCNRKLTCGLHNCEDLCHRGNCPPCWHSSFDELSCHCGASVIYPPIPCGTKPPKCEKPCARTHSCSHPITHTCHSDQSCPPCTFLTEKWCYGKHELRSNVPCYLTHVSCGCPCGNLLPCGLHKCPLTCHDGVCLKPGTKCTLACTKLRPLCSHPCSLKCHGKKPCPESPCKAKVAITCQCGHLTESISCAENQRMIRQAAAATMACKLSNSQPGQSVDISDLMKSNGKNRRLECNEECALIDRNRRLALALQIRNPELTNKLGPPAYSDFLKDYTKSNGRFVANIYNKLTEVVQSAKQSKQKSRSHAFPPMNRDQRRVVHELAEYFGCETQSYDEEPKKNVVVTALRDKSWLPSVSLMTVIERESLHRKAPPPIPHRVQSNTKIESSETTNLSAITQTTEAKPAIDYFDYTP